MIGGSVIQNSGGKNEGVRAGGNRKCVLGLSVLLAAASILAAYWLVSNSLLRLRVSFAEEQTAIVEQMNTEARAGDPLAAVDYLEYTINYYPSGTKQSKGSKLDQIVERARRNAVQQIIADLRAKTGEDHGDPQRWIEAFRASDVAKK